MLRVCVGSSFGFNVDYFLRKSHTSNLYYVAIGLELSALERELSSIGIN